MQSLRRSAVAAARTSRNNLSRQFRRYAHDEHAHTHSHASAEEPMGKGFFGVLAVIPAGWALYYASRKGSDDSEPFLTRMMSSATAGWNDKWAQQTALHVQMIEQAGADRLLFNHAQPVDHVDMRFPEMMNVGSPYNVPAGSQVNMDKVIAKYKRLAYEDNERKLAAIRDNTVRSEQPFEGKSRGRRTTDGA